MEIIGTEFLLSPFLDIKYRRAIKWWNKKLEIKLKKMLTPLYGNVIIDKRLRRRMTN